MFSRPPRRICHSVGFRLTLWYLAIFILSSALLFNLAYFLFYSALRERDREIIRQRAKEYLTAEKTGGFEALAREFRLEEASGQLAGFFVRVADSRNQTALLAVPHGWRKVLPKELPSSAPSYGEHTWTSLRRKEDIVLDIATYRLSGGELLQIGKDSHERKELLYRFLTVFAKIGVPLLILGFIGGFLLAFRALRPIRDLIQTVHKVQSGALQARVPLRRSGDELDELAQLFNEMLARIEKLVSGMKEALDNVAHDLRTPLTRLRTIVEAGLQEEHNPSALREGLMNCAEESERIVTMLNTLLDISEAETGAMHLRLERVNLASLIADVVELYRYVAEEKEIKLETALPQELYARVDPDRMRQIIANLLDNAIKYNITGGTVCIEGSQGGNDVCVSVKDTGVGILPQDLPRIFDRLYRGDKSRSQRGLGLGLSLVRAVVNAHEGRIGVNSSPGEGSLFRLFLPVNPELQLTPKE
jgi:signal transduction histidine kinase